MTNNTNIRSRERELKHSRKLFFANIIQLLDKIKRSICDFHFLKKYRYPFGIYLLARLRQM